MTDVIKIFIGYDPVESIAYHTLCHSILSRSSMPVSITPINQANLKDHYWRPRGEYDSNEFSISRWLVPYLCDYKGKAIWMDCDMIVMDDIAKLWDQDMSEHAVKVVKHDHRPKEDTKFLGATQTTYERKNWSSVILYNCEKCTALTRQVVNTMTPGLWFHQFKWLADDDIGEIEGDWNVLAGYEHSDNPSLIHHTAGGPWHHVFDEYSQDWYRECDAMLQGTNPVKFMEHQWLE